MASTVRMDHYEAPYRGLRMGSDEYLELRVTEDRYELINGVVCMSPSPSFRHQRITTEIASQLRNFLRRNPVGQVAVEVDVRFSDVLVYRPDVIFLNAEKAARCQERVMLVPDVVVEVVSPDSVQVDHVTKKTDYERFGVGEYWIIHPERKSLLFFRLESGEFVEAQVTAEAFDSQAISDFSLDLKAVRELF